MTPGNILFIFSDEHDPRYMGCSGHPLVHTPNLDGLARLSFDGEVARFSAAGASIIFAAEGVAWPAAIGFALCDFKTAIKRLAGPTVQFSLWEGHLAIGQRRFRAEVL